MLRALALLVVLTSLPSAAEEAPEAQRLNELALSTMLAGQERVMRVADRIRIAGAGLCGSEVAPVLGVFPADERTLDDRYRDLDYVEPFVEAAAARFSLRPQPRILAIAPGLPAAEAGLRVGDLVVGVDGEAVEKRLYLDELRRRGGEGRLGLEIEREGESHSVEIEAVMGCAIPTRYAFGPDINAFATRFGKLTGVYFYGGILHFLPDDDSLAVVVGHELAHMALKHAGVGTRRYEAEADYLGAYFAARAGYDVSVAPAVWESFSERNPYAQIDAGFYAHPPSPTRSLALAATLDEIAAKRAAGQPLEPERALFSLERPELEAGAVEAHEEKLRARAIARFRLDHARIQDVGYRLARAGREVCGEEVSPLLGAAVARVRDFMPKYDGSKKRTAEAFGLGDHVTVLAVATDSPAARAGLQPGDELRSIDGRRVKKTKHVFEALRDASTQPLPLGVRRDGKDLALLLPHEVGCWHGIRVVASSEVDTGSHANKHELIVPTGLLFFARDDDELAIAISHQMGHHLLDRMRKIENEPRADALGLRIAHAAGFDISKAPAFWDRYAAEQFWKISTDMDSRYYIYHGGMEIRAPVIRETAHALAADQPPSASAMQAAHE